MLKKHGSYFADWRDSAGRRHRKAFPTLAEAKAFKKALRAARARASKNR